MSHHLQASGEDDDGGDGAENDGDDDDGMLSMIVVDILPSSTFHLLTCRCSLKRSRFAMNHYRSFAATPR